MFWRIRSGSATISVSRAAGNVVEASMLSYSGGHASSPYDTGSSNTFGSLAANCETASFDTAEAGELIVAMASLGDQLNATTFDATDPSTASGGTDTTNAPTAGTWRQRVNNNTALGADHGIGIADAIRATAGATGLIFASTSGNGRHVMIAGAFKLAAAGAPPVTYGLIRTRAIHRAANW